MNARTATQTEESRDQSKNYLKVWTLGEIIYDS